MPESESESDVVAAAADRLYAAAPDEFMALRGELVKAAKADGEAGDAKIIGGLRKPTVPASVVNRYALHDADEVARLGELGDRLRRATNDLDPTKLRELSTERRTLVAELTAAALDHAGKADAPTGQRDEVSATFDAAVADPDVARRLGRLLKPEQFSGFGMPAGPELTLVRGGGGAADKKRKPPEKEPAKPARETATSRRLTREATKARDAFSAADDALIAADTAEQRAHEQVSTLTDELDRLQHELDEAKTELDKARKSARTAKTRRREARTALDRAERKLGK